MAVSTKFFSYGNLGPPPVLVWILLTGFWNDLGQWDDASNWID